mmetsp:Transcript_10708/g.26988  ORF Transcript_10708/g.26988 Transcript_10708/m.26988 type:complete len:239 (-) Transcript_10708:226-942(-)
MRLGVDALQPVLNNDGLTATLRVQWHAQVLLPELEAAEGHVLPEAIIHRHQVLWIRLGPQLVLRHGMILAHRKVNAQEDVKLSSGEEGGEVLLASSRALVHEGDGVLHVAHGEECVEIADSVDVPRRTAQLHQASLPHVELVRRLGTRAAPRSLAGLDADRRPCSLGRVWGRAVRGLWRVVLASIRRIAHRRFHRRPFVSHLVPWRRGRGPSCLPLYRVWGGSVAGEGQGSGARRSWN